MDYELVVLHDRQTDQKYFLLRENLARVGEPRGWGAYLFNPSATVNVIVEAPHPLGDEHSAEIAAQVFANGARGLLIAGAHRRKADLPDLVSSVFHQVHIAWTGGDFGAGPTPAVQVHGYGGFRHDFPADTQVVLSTGDGQITETLLALDRAFDNAGLASYVFNRLSPTSKRNYAVNGQQSGGRFWTLAATKNEQGKQLRHAGGEFLHVEFEAAVRADAGLRQQAAELLTAILSERLAVVSPPPVALFSAANSQNSQHLPQAEAAGEQVNLAGSEALGM